MDTVPSRETTFRPAGRLFAGFLLFCVFLYSALGKAATAHSSTSPAGQKTLQVYFVDVEGGQATLFVTPKGESLLIDTGWPGNDGRDAERITKAVKEAGIRKIDFVLITHFHNDHVGGAPAARAARIPITTFIDHGENRERAAINLPSEYGRRTRNYFRPANTSALSQNREWLSPSTACEPRSSVLMRR